jgi:hypothetical protein
LQGQPGEQFRLAADLESEIEWLARIQNFFNHFAQLVDLNRKDTAILALIVELGDRAPKCEIYRFDPVPENILKTNQQWKFQAARLGLLDDIRQIHRSACVLQWFGDHAPPFADIKILRTPAVNVVQIASLLDIPGPISLARVTHFVTANQPAL